jgi:hypothetical protein
MEMDFDVLELYLPREFAGNKAQCKEVSDKLYYYQRDAIFVKET